MKSDYVKDIAYYMALPYPAVVRRDEEGDFVAKIDELPGCSAHGANPTEAFDNLKEAQQLWIEDALEAGDPVPEPEALAPLPSGKWVQRVPRSLHRKLVQMAKRESVSLNQLVTSMLSDAVASKSLADVLKEAVISRFGYPWFEMAMADPADPWDAAVTYCQRNWSFGPARRDLAPLQSLRRAGNLTLSSKKLNFPTTDAYKKETTKGIAELAKR